MHEGCNGFIDRETAEQQHKKGAQNWDIYNPQNGTMVRQRALEHRENIQHQL